MNQLESDILAIAYEQITRIKIMALITATGHSKPVAANEMSFTQNHFYNSLYTWKIVNL